MAFTNNDDVNILQSSDTAIVGAGEGNDVYIITEALTSSGQSITISDPKGSNIIRINEGLEISESIVTNNVVQLKLSNGSTITVLDADNFSYELGGNVFTGADAVQQNFSTFVTNSLGYSSVPSEGAPPESKTDSFIVNADFLSGLSSGNDQSSTMSVDQGTLDSPFFLDASAGAIKFIDDASVFGNVEISSFTNDDIIDISGVAKENYSFSNDGEDVNITYNNSGTMNIITLMGVVDSSNLVYDEASFEAAIGFDAIV